MFIYLSHLGGLYCSDEKVSRELLYCETCGDSDTLVCECSQNDPMVLLAALPNYISWDGEELLDFINQNFFTTGFYKESLAAAIKSVNESLECFWDEEEEEEED